MFLVNYLHHTNLPVGHDRAMWDRPDALIGLTICETVPIMPLMSIFRDEWVVPAVFAVVLLPFLAQIAAEFRC